MDSNEMEMERLEEGLDGWNTRVENQLTPPQPERSEQKRWKQEDFKKRECNTFIEDSSRDGRCQCGLPRGRHQQGIKTAEDTQWTTELHSSEQQTDAFGLLKFEGERDWVKFLRLSSDTKPSHVYDLMTRSVKEDAGWGMDPPPLVVSLVGEEGRSEVKPWVQEVIKEGLVKALAKTAIGSSMPWILTEGFDEGIGRCVGEAVKDTKVRAVGISPWGVVHNKAILVDPEGREPVKLYSVENNSDSCWSLEKNHHHFLLVDDGTECHRGGEKNFSVKFEEHISTKHIRDITVPVLCILISGELSILERVDLSLKNSTPWLVLAGSGGVADLLSDILVNQSPATAAADVVRVTKLVTKHFPSEAKSEAQIDQLVEQVQSIYQNRKLITFYHEEKDRKEDFDTVMIKALMPASKQRASGNTFPYSKELFLARTWYRMDFACSQLFNDDISDDVLQHPSWDGALKKCMTHALINDKTQFVYLLVKKNFIPTYGFLEKLYTLEDTPVNQLLLEHLKERLGTSSKKKEISLLDVSGVLMKFMGEKKPFYFTEGFKKALERANELLEGACSYRNQLCESPWTHLFIWAVLQNHSDMAVLFWEAKESVLNALSACKMLKEMSKMEYETETKRSMKDLSLKFENLAHDGMVTRYQSDDNNSFKLLNKVSPFWGKNCFKMAMAAELVNFFNHDGFEDEALEYYMMSFALINDKTQSVSLLIEKKPNFGEYLTYGLLEKLYSRVDKDTLLYKLLLEHLKERLGSPYHDSLKEISLLEVSGVLQMFMGEEKPFYFTALGLKDFTSGKKALERANELPEGACSYRNQLCESPWTHLFIWAVLQNRSAMADTFWKKIEEPVLNALSACKMLREMSTMEYETEPKRSMKELSLKFEKLAHDTMVTYQSDENNSFKLLNKVSPVWGTNCFKMAIAADLVNFFNHDGLEDEALKDCMTFALLNDKAQFVDLFIEKLDFEKYLTYGLLEKLYSTVNEDTLLYKLLLECQKERLGTSDSLKEISLFEVSGVLQKFMGGEKPFYFTVLGLEDFTSGKKALEHVKKQKEPLYRNQLCESPRTHLFIWAVLQNRSDMADIFWKKIEEPVLNALSACKMLREMSTMEYKTEPKRSMKEVSLKFEKLAHDTMVTYQSDENNSFKLLNKVSPVWGTNCFKMAIAADLVNFFNHDGLEDEALKDCMTFALLNDKAQFVDLFIEKKLDYEQYLTYGLLEKLYSTVNEDTLLYKLLLECQKERLGTSDLDSLKEISLFEVSGVLQKFMGGEKPFYFTVLGLEDFTSGKKALEHVKKLMLQKEPLYRNQLCESPWTHLFIWAVLQNRSDMADIFWKKIEEPVLNALSACKMLREMSTMEYKTEPKRSMKEVSLKFEKLAHDTMVTYQSDENNSFKLLNKVSPVWGTNCFKMAIAADLVNFFKHDGLEDEALKDCMTFALLNDKAQFVDLFIEKKLDFEKYLTYGLLEKLYSTVNEDTLLYKLLLECQKERLGTSDLDSLKEISLFEVSGVLQKFTGEEKPFYFTVLGLEDFTSGKKALERAKELLEGECAYRNQLCESPWTHLFIWAVLQNRSDMAVLFWKRAEEPVLNALGACKILKKMSKLDIQTEAKHSMEKLAQEFEKRTNDMLSSCYQSNESHSFELLKKQSPVWEKNCFQFVCVESYSFFKLNGLESTLSHAWRGDMKKDTTWWKVLLTLFCPLLLCTNLITFREDEKEKSKLFKLSRWHMFWRAPITSFVGNAVMYLPFLFLFAYVLLVDFKPSGPFISEYVLYFWVFTFICQEIYEVFFMGDFMTLRQRMKLYIEDGWNHYDLTAILLFIIGIISRMFEWSYEFGRCVLCIDYMVFTLRLIHIFAVHKRMGPKIIIVGKMMKDVAFFLLFLVVWIVAYGVATQGLLYDYDPNLYRILRRVIYRPYLYIFGVLNLEEIDVGLDWDKADNCTFNVTEIEGGAEPCRNKYWLSNCLVIILLVVFLLVTIILLINLLIAMLSNTFDHVQEKSDHYWNFQHYNLIVEYQSRPALAPPFIILSHLHLFFSFLKKKFHQELPSTTMDHTVGIEEEKRAKMFKDWETKQNHNFITAQSDTVKRSDSERIEQISNKVDRMEKQLNETKASLNEQFTALTKMENTLGQIVDLLNKPRQHRLDSGWQSFEEQGGGLL